MSRLSKAWGLAASIRVGEVLVLQGAPVLGIAFSIGGLTPDRLVAALIFFAANFLLVAHIFTLNDWADFTRGLHHASGAMVQLESRSITPRALLSFSLLLLAASLALFLFFSTRCFLLATVIALLGILYSYPALNGKSAPVLSSLLHFLGGLLHFLLGYSLFSPLDERGFVVGSFFGVTFAAGHLNQEVRDFEVDQQTGARTNAVAFGKRLNFRTGLILFSLAYIYLFCLAWAGFIPRPLAILAVVVWPAHVALSLRTLHKGLTSESIRQFQTQYRLIYALIGLTMVASLLWR